jgi:hypothetical protein
VAGLTFATVRGEPPRPGGMPALEGAHAEPVAGETPALATVVRTEGGRALEPETPTEWRREIALSLLLVAFVGLIWIVFSG